MKKTVRLDLIKLINADTFVAFDDKVRGIATRARETNEYAPYIEVNGDYSTYQHFLNAYRLGKYSAADVVCLCYNTNCVDNGDGWQDDNYIPVELAAVGYEAPVSLEDAVKIKERSKEAVDELASCLKSYLFGNGNTINLIEKECDRIRGEWGALTRVDVAATDRVETLTKITATLCNMHAALQGAYIAAHYWAAQARATIEALEG